MLTIQIVFFKGDNWEQIKCDAEKTNAKKVG
jgi:hypothetical protein